MNRLIGCASFFYLRGIEPLCILLLTRGVKLADSKQKAYAISYLDARLETSGCRSAFYPGVLDPAHGHKTGIHSVLRQILLPGYEGTSKNPSSFVVMPALDASRHNGSRAINRDSSASGTPSFDQSLETAHDGNQLFRRLDAQTAITIEAGTAGEAGRFSWDVAV